MKRLFTLMALFAFVGGINAQIIFQEDFESGNSLTLDAEWQLTTIDGFASDFFNPGEHSTFIGINDDQLGGAAPAIPGARATFGPLDLSTAENPMLTFSAYFLNGDYGGDETLKLYSSTDGTNFTEIFDVQGGRWDEVFVRLNQFAGETSIFFAFEYADGGVWNYGAAIDDITLLNYTIMNDVASNASYSTCGAAQLGTEVFFSGSIRNMGLDNLTSFDVTWTNGTVSETETIEGVDIPFREFYTFDYPSSFTIEEIGAAPITFTVDNPNGNMDEVMENSVGELVLAGVPIMENQAVVVEEATGTWCTWCPRGAVWLDRMADCIGESFIGIAVHNGDNDPMVLPAYDAGATAVEGFPGFPSVNLDRRMILDPSEIETPTVQKITQSPDVIIGISADWDETTRELNVTGYADMQISTETGYRWVGVLTEDGVTGTGPGWEQINAYSGGAFGPMGGYENLPNPVPASMMVYDHVGRALLAGYAGVADAGLENLSVGDQPYFDFDSYVVPEQMNTENMHIVVMIVSPDGDIINANSVTVNDAVTTSVKDVEFDHDLAKVFPNPFNDMTNIRLDLEQTSQVSISVFNTVGQVVARKDYGALSGDVILPFYSDNLANGSYFIHISVDDKLITKQVQIAK